MHIITYNSIFIRQQGIKFINNLDFLEEAQIGMLEFFSIETLSRYNFKSKQLKKELWAENEYQGAAHIIKQYTFLDDDYKLKCRIQHGSKFTNKLSDIEVSDLSPVSLVWGDYTKRLFKQKTPSKELYSVGAPFFYAKNLLEI